VNALRRSEVSTFFSHSPYSNSTKGNIQFDKPKNDRKSGREKTHSQDIAHLKETKSLTNPTAHTKVIGNRYTNTQTYIRSKDKIPGNIRNLEHLRMASINARSVKKNGDEI
jgi:hypothetical protein